MRLILLFTVFFYSSAFAQIARASKDFDPSDRPVNLVSNAPFEMSPLPGTAHSKSLPMMSVIDHHASVPADGDRLVPRRKHMGTIFPKDVHGLPFLNFERPTNVAQWAALGKKTAIQAIAEAYGKVTDSNVQNFLVKVYTALDGSPILTPPAGQDFVACDAGTLAFALVGRPGIYVCSLAMDYASYGAPYLAEIIVHESAHVAGISDECMATNVEVAVMTLSSFGLQFKNGYWAQCGLN